MGGGMFAGILEGYTGAAHERNQKLMEIEIESRKGLSQMYQTLAENPNVPPELQQKFLEYAVQIPQLPYDKKLPKQFTDMGAIMRERQQIRPPALPAPGNIPAREGDLPPPTGEPRSIFHTAGERRLMEAEEAEAKTATDLNTLMRYRQAGLLPSGVKRDVQDPLLMPAGSVAMMRDPAGVFTGESLQAPFKQDAGPELSMTDQIAIQAYAIDKKKPVTELSAVELQEALGVGREALRRPEGDRIIPVITTDRAGEPATLYLPESLVTGRMFPRPGGAGSQSEEMKASANKLMPVIERLAGNIFTTEGVAALASGAYKSMRAYFNLDVDLAEYKSLLIGFAPIFARAIGHSGVLTELDTQNTLKLFPQPGDSKELSDRKLKNVKSIMSGDTPLPFAWDPMGMAISPPPDLGYRNLTNEELLTFMER